MKCVCVHVSTHRATSIEHSVVWCDWKRWVTPLRQHLPTISPSLTHTQAHVQRRWETCWREQSLTLTLKHRRLTLFKRLVSFQPLCSTVYSTPLSDLFLLIHALKLRRWKVLYGGAGLWLESNVCDEKSWHETRVGFQQLVLFGLGSRLKKYLDFITLCLFLLAESSMQKFSFLTVAFEITDCISSSN